MIIPTKWKGEINKIGILILASFFSNCTPSIYFVATDSTLELTQIQPNKKKIIYLQNTLAESSILDKTAEILNQRGKKQFEFIKHNFKNSDLIYLRAIKNLISEEYKKAQLSLDSLSDSQYDCHVQILKADCLYETKASSSDIKSLYQKSIDCTESEIIKSIAKTRYRFLRYD